MMSQRVSNFFRAYHVRMPSAKITEHNPAFIREAIDNIDQLLRITQDEEFVNALEQLKVDWQRIAARPATGPVARAGQPVNRGFESERRPRVIEKSLETIQREFELISPFKMWADSEDTITEQLEKIATILDNEVIDHRCRHHLKSWIREWRIQQRKLSVDYGGTTERRGPPAAYLAKRSARATKDAELRRKMQSNKKG